MKPRTLDDFLKSFLESGSRRMDGYITYGEMNFKAKLYYVGNDIRIDLVSAGDKNQKKLEENPWFGMGQEGIKEDASK